MRNRSTAAAVAIVAVLVPLLVVTTTPAMARAAPVVGADRLDVDSGAAVAGGTVTVSGSCAGVGGGGDPDVYPEATDIGIGGVVVAHAAVVANSGRWKDTTVTVPGALAPQEYQFTSTCGRREPVAVVPFTVLPAPLLTIAPERVDAGDDVTATGTCGVGQVDLFASPVELLLDGQRSLATATLHGNTGVLEDLTFSLPEDVAPGGHTVDSTCGGSDGLTILQPPGQSSTPPSTTGSSSPPPQDLVTVPNLVDSTEQEARLAVGDDLVLHVSGEGHVARQDPQPGELVTRGSTVAVVLEQLPLPPDGSWLPVAGAAVLVLLALVALTLVVRRALRRRRDRRFLEDRVRIQPDRGRWAMPPGPDVVVPSIDVHIEVRREPPRLEFQEVGRARD
jgi:hypothetical protein